MEIKSEHLIDISPLVSERTAVFPGDQPFMREVSMTYAKGHHLELSAIKTTLHIGAHADAPSHYVADGESIDKRSLKYYIGPCQVIHVQIPRGERILPKHIERESIQAPRILFRTDSFINPDKWVDDFNSLSPELIQYLVERGVFTVGIDTPSIDPADSKKLESHAMIAQKNMAVLEGVILTQAPAGQYQLIAQPLRLANCDASPVRALLLKNVT